MFIGIECPKIDNRLKTVRANFKRIISGDKPAALVLGVIFALCFLNNF